MALAFFDGVSIRRFDDMYTRRKLKFPILVIGDIVLLYGSLFAMLWLRYPEASSVTHALRSHVVPFSILFIFWILAFVSLDLYEPSVTKNEFTFTKRLARATLMNALFGIILFYGIPSFQITPRVNLFLVLAFSAGSIFVWRHVFNGIIARSNADRVMFFGITDEVSRLAQYLRTNPQYAFQPVLFITTKPSASSADPQPTYPLNHTIKDLIKRFSVDTIVAAEDIADNKMLARVFFDVLPLGVRFINFPNFYEMITGKIPVFRINELWFLENFVRVKNAWYERVKRVLDLVLAAALCVPFFILTPLIAGCIALDSRGPIFYRQKRVGKGGVSIEIIKFRSMIADAETGKALWADENDPRVTRVGTILRKTRLDELPQLINVLRGEMSFIGPRPERPEFVARLEKEIPFYQMRHLVTPGLTGWAQINFPYGASVTDAMEKLQYDFYYIKHRSLALDISILLRTIVVVLSGAGR